MKRGRVVSRAPLSGGAFPELDFGAVAATRAGFFSGRIMRNSN